MQVVDDITALSAMHLICPQVGHKTTYQESDIGKPYRGLIVRPAIYIINDLLKTNKWLACEALANYKHSYNTQPFIYRENREVYESLKEDINEWFEQ